MNDPAREDGWAELTSRGARYRSRALPSPDYPARVIEALPGRSDPTALFTIQGMEEEWHVFERALAHCPARRVLAFDMAWSGSAGYQWALADQTVVDRLRTAFESSPAKPSVLVAHSFGTIVLLHYLAKHAHPGLEAIVLIAPFYMPPNECLDWQRLAYLSERYQRFLELAVAVRVERALEPEILSGMAEHIRANIGPEGCVEFLHHFVRTRAIDLERIRTPVLIISGADDFYSGAEEARKLAERLPSAEVMIVEGAGHFAMLEKPREVGGRIAEFLNRHVKSREVER